MSESAAALSVPRPVAGGPAVPIPVPDGDTSVPTAATRAPAESLPSDPAPTAALPADPGRGDGLASSSATWWVGTATSSLPQPSAAGPAAPGPLRLVPAPGCEPPYDDELPAAPVLRLVPPAGPVAPVPGRARPVPPAPPVPRPSSRTGTGQLPDVHPFAQALVQRLLEVRGGVRPVPQLQRDTTPTLYADLERALARRPRPVGPRPSSRDVRSVHVQERPDGVAEVCATVRRGERMAALALRLEGHRGHWLCTQIQGL